MPGVRFSPVVCTMITGFALVCRDDGPADRRQVAELLAETLDRPVANVLPAISFSWGILAEGLTEFTARRCADVLQGAGLAVDMLADDQLFQLPPRVDLHAAVFAADGLTYNISHMPHRVAWSDFVFVDVVRLQTGKMEPFTDTQVEINSPGILPSTTVVQVHGEHLSTDFPLYLDAIAREPWTWLRISLDDFVYPSTGLPLRATRKVNFYALAFELANRSPQTATGPGYRTVIGQDPLYAQETLTEDAWEQRLRWRLTRIVHHLA